MDAAVAEAAARFAIPEHWIRSVMGVESAFRPRALSPAGAMGLMQLMPGTYAGLRARYGLGADPYAPRDNILAGAAYLREMYDRYGAGGFLAAYNAGPRRYEQHLRLGRALPAETRAYVATLAPRIDVAGASGALPVTPRPSLFVPLARGTGAERALEFEAPREGRPAGPGLFVALTTTGEGR